MNHANAEQLGRTYTCKIDTQFVRFISKSLINESLGLSNGDWAALCVCNCNKYRHSIEYIVSLGFKKINIF